MCHGTDKSIAQKKKKRFTPKPLHVITEMHICFRVSMDPFYKCAPSSIDATIMLSVTTHSNLQ